MASRRENLEPSIGIDSHSTRVSSVTAPLPSNSRFSLAISAR